MTLPPTDLLIDAAKFLILPAVGATIAVHLLLALGVRAVSGLVTFNRKALDPAMALLALLAALVVSNYFRGAFPDRPDGKWWHWAWPALGLLLLAEGFARMPVVAVGVGHLLRGAGAGVVAATIISPATLKDDSHRWILPVLALVLSINWAITDAVGRRLAGSSTTLALALTSFSTSAVLIHHHLAGLCDVAAMMGISLILTAILSLRTGQDCGAAAAAAVGMNAVLLVLGWQLTESKLTESIFLAVGLSPVLLGVFLLPQLQRVMRARWLLVLLVVALPCGWAVYQASQRETLAFSSEM